jgi:hypothetical protein
MQEQIFPLLRFWHLVFDSSPHIDLIDLSELKTSHENALNEFKKQFEVACSDPQLAQVFNLKNLNLTLVVMTIVAQLQDQQVSTQGWNQLVTQVLSKLN